MTRLARGLPAGSNIEYANRNILADAISGAFLGAATNESLSGTLVALALVLAGRAAVAWAQESSAHGASAAVKSRLRIAILARAVRLGPGAAGGATTGGTAPGGGR